MEQNKTFTIEDLRSPEKKEIEIVNNSKNLLELLINYGVFVMIDPPPPFVNLDEEPTEEDKEELDSYNPINLFFFDDDFAMDGTEEGELNHLIPVSYNAIKDLVKHNLVEKTLVLLPGAGLNLIYDVKDSEFVKKWGVEIKYKNEGYERVEDIHNYL